MTDKKTTKVKVFGTSKTTLFGDIKSIFGAYSKSKEVEAIRSKVKLFVETKGFAPETIEKSRKEITALKKEIKLQQEVISIPVNTIRTENQAIFKPLTESLEAKRIDLLSSALAYDNEQRRIKAEKQAELDRQFLAAKKVADDARREAAAAAEKARQAGEEPKPVHIAEPVEVQVEVDTVAKSVLPDNVDAAIKDPVALARLLLRPGGSIPTASKLELFREIFRNPLISPIQAKVRNNFGRQDIVDDFRGAGVELKVRGYGVK